MNSEQKSALIDAIEDGSALRPLLALIEQCAEKLEEEVIITSAEDEKKLVLAKARAEGARRLIWYVTSEINNLKSKSEKTKT